MTTPEERGISSNWGRWGADDQRGTANLLSAAGVLAAAQTRADRKGLFIGRPAFARRPQSTVASPDLARRHDAYARLGRRRPERR